jgi:polyphosphate glucokinase
LTILTAQITATSPAKKLALNAENPSGLHHFTKPQKNHPENPETQKMCILPPMKVLVIDVGGTNIKVSSTDNLVPIKIASGPQMTATMMVDQVLAASKSWKYDAISIGYPGPVEHAHPLAEPHNLAPGWIDFPYQKAFRKPILFINDAAMQAYGGYKGGRMLFLGIGTGLGSAMIFDGVIIPLELAHLPYKKGGTYEDYTGRAALERLGKKKWRKSVLDVIDRLKSALVCDYVLLGGGNAKLMKSLPSNVILGANSNAVRGGIRLWENKSPDVLADELGAPAGSPARKKNSPRQIVIPRSSSPRLQ